jgi:hypothetical protein
LEVFTWANTHCGEVQPRHFVEDMLRGPAAIQFTRLSIREDDFFDKFSDCSSEAVMVLGDDERLVQ